MGVFFLLQTGSHPGRNGKSLLSALLAVIMTRRLALNLKPSWTGPYDSESLLMGPGWRLASVAWPGVFSLSNHPAF